MVMYLFTANTVRQMKTALITSQKTLRISLDLGITYENLKIENKKIVFPNGSHLGIDDIKIKLKDKDVYYLDNNSIKKFYFFSDNTGYKLIPTKTWTTLTINSTPMHRYTFVDPKADTESKINLLKPVIGNVLDTCMGLGYTAILASKTADKVVTFEKDKNVIEIARLNPFSKELFLAKNITIRDEDVFYAIKKFRNKNFDRIIHDPPTLRYAGELYSDEFYKQIFRVLKDNGIAYLYVPRPGISKNKANLKNTIMKRLKHIGFSVVYSEEAQGIRATKQIPSKASKN